MPDDLAKLTNVGKNETVKKTDFSADDYVKKTKFSADTNALDDKIDKVGKKIPDVSNLATKSSVTVLIRDLNDRIDKIKIKDSAKKTSLSGYMLTSTFNTKSTELENKIKDADIIPKSSVTKANAIKSDLNDYAKKTDVANDITTIKNDYVSNASLTSRLNGLKSQHIATEVKIIDDKIKKNASDILALENKLQQKEDTINENERGLSFNRGFFYYLQQSYLVYECKIDSFIFNNKKILKWRSTGIFNYSDYFSINFQQNDVIVTNNNNVINIYVVDKSDPISSTRNTDYTIQNASFGAMKITKNTDSSKTNYTRYGLCFDEGGQFGHTVKQR